MAQTLRFSKQISLGLALLLFGACANPPAKHQSAKGAPTTTVKLNTAGKQVLIPGSQQPALAVVGEYSASFVSGDYAGYQSVIRFIDYMADQHGFNRSYLNGLFSIAKRKQWTLDYLTKSDQSLKAKASPGSWSRYRKNFLDARHINNGVVFWNKHRDSLERASRQFGIPAEYILGIMAVETTFGSYVGNHRVIDALTTLAFDYRRRGEYFRSELEKFLLMSRSEHLDPAKPVGSYAGAMGLGQFMPSSFLAWAVDFNGDGRRDLWNPEDTIGSVANYFAQHGWKPGQPVISALHGNLSVAGSLEQGLDHVHSFNSLEKVGLSPAHDCHCDVPIRLLCLKHQKHDEYLLAYPNFYVITRYNHSTHYAMAVHELAQAIKNAYRNQS